MIDLPFNHPINPINDSANKYMGKPCVKCGSESRYLSTNHCVPCSKKNNERRRYGKIDSEATKRRHAIEEHQKRKREEDQC